MYKNSSVNFAVNAIQSKSYKIFIVAGEDSGNNLAYSLIKAMKLLIKNHAELLKPNHITLGEESIKLNFYGVGGESLKKLGMKILFSSNELALIGFSEILPSLMRLINRMDQVIQAIENYKPDILITIDSPGFNFRLVKKLRKRFKLTIPIIHYVAPTVWAYNPKRAVQVSELYNHIMLLFPFESQYFDKMPHTFVGHPVTEYINSFKKSYFNKQGIRDKYELTDGDLLITIMAGSRESELKHHLPILKQAIYKIFLYYKHKNKRVRFFFPTNIILFPKLQIALKAISEELNDPDLFIIKTVEEEKLQLIYISELAIVKSGTSILEVMALGVPIVAFYKLSFFTAFLLKLKLKIKHITLCNILLQEQVIAELLQENFTAENIFTESISLLDDERRREWQINKFNLAIEMLNDKGKIKPSEKAAETVLKILLK